MDAAVGKEGCRAIVTQNRVLSTACCDLIRPRSADDSVRAAGQSNRVGRTTREVSALRTQQNTGVTQHELAVIAQHESTSPGRCSCRFDGVTGRSADHNVEA